MGFLADHFRLVESVAASDCPRLLSPKLRPRVWTLRFRSARCAAFGNNSERQTADRNDCPVCVGLRGMTLAKWTSFPIFPAAGHWLTQDSRSHAVLVQPP